MRDERHAIRSDPAQLHEVGRYAVSEEARVLVGRRIEGEVFVYDYPRDGQGRRYFVESGFESKAELAVLLANYKRQAREAWRLPDEPRGDRPGLRAGCPA